MTVEEAKKELLDSYIHHNQNDNSDVSWLDSIESLIDAKIEQQMALKLAAKKASFTDKV